MTTRKSRNYTHCVWLVLLLHSFTLADSVQAQDDDGYNEYGDGYAVPVSYSDGNDSAYSGCGGELSPWQSVGSDEYDTSFYTGWSEYYHERADWYGWWGEMTNAGYFDQAGTDYLNLADWSTPYDNE